MQSLAELATHAASEASKLLKSHYRQDAAVTTSAVGKDIKTQADVAAEQLIISILSESGIPVIAEETASDVLLQGDNAMWIVDPLDGTMNWTRGFPVASVSIALWEKGQPRLGVIEDLFNDRVFVGEAGKSAFCNHVEMSVSSVSESSDAVLATGFPVLRSYEADDLSMMISQLQSFKKVRMIGSAAMSLAYVAKGVFDVYSEDNIMLWDIAAGLALVKAAGGDYAMTPGTCPNAYNVIATNGNITTA
jgi:myo-inositol-1(or 4)-monophosphatase